MLVELMRVKAGQQMEESQLRYNQQVLQQQYRETTALVSEGRRTLNALRPTLNSNRRKVCFYHSHYPANRREKINTSG